MAKVTAKQAQEKASTKELKTVLGKVPTRSFNRAKGIYNNRSVTKKEVVIRRMEMGFDKFLLGTNLFEQ